MENQRSPDGAARNPGLPIDQMPRIPLRCIRATSEVGLWCYTGATALRAGRTFLPSRYGIVNRRYGSRISTCYGNQRSPDGAARNPGLPIESNTPYSATLHTGYE
ncbi:MAG: hypothetical protein ACU85E_12175 [Gammaproteobacteria bacterium]